MSWRARWRRVIRRLAARSEREGWRDRLCLAIDLACLRAYGPRTARYLWHRSRRFDGGDRPEGWSVGTITIGTPRAAAQGVTLPADGARVEAVRDADASDDLPGGRLRAGDAGTVTAAEGDMVLVRFDRWPERTAVCYPDDVRDTPQPAPDVK